MTHHATGTGAAALVLCGSALGGEAQALVPVGATVLRDGFEPETFVRWQTNACEIAPETETAHGGNACLKLTDRGGNAQVFVELTALPRLTYAVSVFGLRRASNKGSWHGCAAVSYGEGRGNQNTSAARSQFIEKADRWCELTLSFSARSSRVFLILTGQNADGDVTLFGDLRVTCEGVPAVEVGGTTAGDAPTEPESVVLAGAAAVHAGPTKSAKSLLLAGPNLSPDICK